MVDYPERSLIEERAAGMNIDLMVILERSVTLCGVLLCDVKEVACSYGFAYFNVVFAAGSDLKFVALHDLE